MFKISSNCWPKLGCGVGLRAKHYPEIVDKWPEMDWFEAISENYMDTGGRPVLILGKIRKHYPVALHGTALSIGSTDPLNPDYLKRLKRLVERIDPFIVSDHLCWSGMKGEVLHDLLPLPFTEESIRHVVDRMDQVQEFLGRSILVENVSTYVTYRHSTMSEWEFISEVAKRSGSGILLDVNNVFVNATNHKFNPHEYLRNIPGKYVGQIHLAGHTDMGDFLFDTHSAPVVDQVWDLYREALGLWGPVSTLIEWDEDIPPFEQLAEEAKKAREIYRQTHAVIASEAPLEVSTSIRGEAKQSTSSEIASSRRRATGRLMDSYLVPAEVRRPSASLAAPPRNDGVEDISLLDAEEWMKSKIRPVGAGLPRLPKGAETAPVQPLLNPQGRASGEERLSVYANGYVARITEALSEVYETIRHLLGGERFSALCRAYADCYPSHDYNLNFVGMYFPEFLGQLTDIFPYLPDLARLEWAVWRAFHAFDKPPLDTAKMAEIPMEEWEKARIIFQPSVAILSSRWPVLDLWRNRRNIPEDIKKCLAESEQRILIGRRGDQVRCEALDEHQYELLQELLSGGTLGGACERLAEHLEGGLPPIAGWFQGWLQDGLIVRCVMGPSPFTVKTRSIS